MAREKPLYRDTLADLTVRAAKLYPNKTLLNAAQVAVLLGCCRKTVYNRYGRIGNVTLPQLASMIC